MADFPPQIKARLERGMGCWSGIGDGWMSIVIELDEQLAKIAPDYTIDQIKEKYGALRYYIGTVADDVYDETQALIRKAEERSMVTCESCGAEAQLLEEAGWLSTLCASCRARRTAQRQAR